MDLPAAKSHRRMVVSWEPVTICGSLAWQITLAMVCEWPVRVCTLALVRMSHTRAVESRPAVTSTSIDGWRARVYTAER